MTLSPTIPNINDATTRYAEGILTPWMRVMSHVGYCYAILSNETIPWDDRRNDIRADLREMESHLSYTRPVNAFVSTDIIRLFNEIESQIPTLRQADTTEEDMKTSLANLAHNACYAIARAEHDLIGENATAGTEI